MVDEIRVRRQRRKLPYTEGSVFLVPLQDRGYARGVVTRATKRGRVLFGYFFGPRVLSKEGMSMGDLISELAILRAQFGDLGLIEGTWMIYGTIPDWDRAEWPMPDLVFTDPINNQTWLRRYSDTDPRVLESQTRSEPRSDLPKDGIYGRRAVEITLTKLLE